MPKNSQRAKWNTANARLANKPFDNLFDGSFRSTQEIADSMQSFTPVIQWGAVSQKWHVTFLDWTDEVYTGDTIRQALEAAEQGLHLTGGILCGLQALSTPHHFPAIGNMDTPPHTQQTQTVGRTAQQKVGNMPKVSQVTLWDVKEKLPESNAMIIANDGEWHILMYEGENVGYCWEDDEPVTFSRWAYLSDMDTAQPALAGGRKARVRSGQSKSVGALRR